MALRSVQTDRVDVREVWETTRDEIARLDALAIVQGREVSATVAAGANVISHGLGRQPRGWIVVDRTAAVTLHRTAWDAKHLTLTSTGAATIALWVF